MWPKDKLLFGTAVLDLLLAAVEFSDRNSPYGGPFYRYVWLMLLFTALVLFYRSYRTGK